MKSFPIKVLTEDDKVLKDTDENNFIWNTSNLPCPPWLGPRNLTWGDEWIKKRTETQTHVKNLQAGGL